VHICLLPRLPRRDRATASTGPLTATATCSICTIVITARIPTRCRMRMLTGGALPMGGLCRLPLQTTTKIPCCSPSASQLLRPTAPTAGRAARSGLADATSSSTYRFRPLPRTISVFFRPSILVLPRERAVRVPPSPMVAAGSNRRSNVRWASALGRNSFSTRSPRPTLLWRTAAMAADRRRSRRAGQCPGGLRERVLAARITVLGERDKTSFTSRSRMCRPFPRLLSRSRPELMCA